MAKKKEISYADSFAEAQKILFEIENEDIDVDTLSLKVKKAAQLLQSCKNKLVKTEKEVEKIFDSLTEK